LRYWTQLAMEQFPPSSIVEQAVGAERANFDAVNVSDHLQPWWEPGESGHAWVTLGAIGRATERVQLGTGVTAPVFRHNPIIVAQRIREIEETGATVVCLQNASGADPLRALEVYGERVLPILRGSQAAAAASTA
jgi:hypothetical protein